MALGRTRFRGNVKLHGRPKEHAKAEIMIMKQQEAYEDRKRRRTLFTALDIVIVIAYALAIYFVYLGDYTKFILSLLMGTIPLVYFIIRRLFKNKGRN